MKINQSPRSRAPKRPAHERKRLILESSEAVFANSNYANVSTAELARAAGVSEPALYRHFSGKRDLYASTLKVTGTRLLGIWRHIRGGVRDPLEAIQMLGLGYYDHLNSRSPVLKLFFEAMAEAGDPEIRKTVRDNFLSLVCFIEETLQEAKAQGSVRPDVDLRVAAWQFVANGIALDLIHMLDLDKELNREKIKAWGEHYLNSLRRRPRNR
jgi:AcrR family transcriptional regulator